MSNKRSRKRRSRPAPRPAPVETEDLEPIEETQPSPRRGFLSGAMFASGPSPMPGLWDSVRTGLVAVVTQPALVVAVVAIVAVTWFLLVALGFEGTPGRLVAVLALPPISTYFDLGTGSTMYGIGPGFLAFIATSLLIRTVVFSLLAGAVLEAVEDGRVSTYGLLRGLRAITTVLAVNVLSFSIIIGGNLILPVLGPGIGFLGFVSALVAGLFFLGFAPTAAIREGRPVVDEIRRSGRAALLPNSKHLVLCSLYFFLALPILVGFAPGGSEITANPSLATWVFAFVVNVLHVAFMAALAYRWVVAEDAVPDQPIRRMRARASRAPAKAPTARARRS